MIENKSIVKILGVFNVISLSLLAILALAVALAPTVNKFGLFQPTIVIFFAAIILCIATIYFANLRLNKVLSKYLIPSVVVLAFILILIIQLIFARALLSDGYTWDANTVYQAALTFVQHSALDPGSSGYLRTSPNNIPLFLVLTNLFEAMKNLGMTNYLWGAVILNVLISFLVQVLIYLVCKLLFGRRIAICSIFFSFILIGLNLHIQTPYTDTLAILFPILILYLSLKFLDVRNVPVRILLSMILGIVAMAGVLIKPTVIISLIALALAGVAWLISEKKDILKNKQVTLITSCLGLVVLAASCTYVGFSTFVDSQKILPYSYTQSSDHGLPPQHFINIGMKSQIDGYSVNYGGYNSDAAQTVSKLTTKEARVSFSNDGIKKQLSQYGLLGYGGFLSHKIKWIASDATFFAYGEGDISKVHFINNDPISQNIRQYAYVNGSHYQQFGNTMQVVWIALLLFIAMQLIISLLWKAARTNVFLTILHLMIVGILLFLLIFEGRSRYLFLYVPIFIVTAMYTLDWFRNITKENEPVSLVSKPTTKADNL